GSVALYKKGAKPDAFLTAAFDAQKPQLNHDRTRLAMPVPGTSGRNEWVLDIRSASGTFGENDVFALDLLRGYTGTAIQNLALFGELQSQRASVIQLNTLKDDLIAVLAHDFKGPLTTIMGFTDLLENDGIEGEDARGALRTIRQSAVRLAALANDTLALSRVEQGDLNLDENPVDVSAILQEAAEALRAERAISVVAKAGGAVVRGDPARLRQVIDNIVGNAIKYSPGGEPVRIEVKQTEQTIRISVSDSGIGVPANEMNLIFERFRRASNAKSSKIKGTGLGLYLAKTLVERHGGTIHVQSAVGEGSTFTLVLPRMRDGLGGVLRVMLLTADEHLAPYVLYELRAHGQAARHDRTLTAALERLSVESADVAIVDCDSIQVRLDPPMGLVRIGGRAADAHAAGEGWHAHVPKPFLAGDLREAIAIADRARTGGSAWKRTQR
ncbi:MAG: sensor histidine kinase, partial [Candidatus Baltobacteraceae bacterium]